MTQSPTDHNIIEGWLASLAPGYVELGPVGLRPTNLATVPLANVASFLAW